MTPAEHTRKQVIACVVLNWNGVRDTETCVKSLLASEGVEVDVVVVDNGSTDGSVATLGGRWPQLPVLQQTRNVGVARGFNLGVDWAIDKGYGFVFFLNNDATVGKDCLHDLKEVLDDEGDVAIVSPRIVDRSRPGRLWFDGGTMNLAGDPVHVSMGAYMKPRAGPEEREFATGCAMMVRTQAFADAGRFDERFFAYSEDVDFCLRVREKGWRIIHDPRAVVTHTPSSATQRNRGKWFRDYYVTRNKLLLLSGRMKAWRWFLFLTYFGIRYVALPCGVFSLRGEFQRVRAIRSGVADFMKGRFGERYS